MNDRVCSEAGHIQLPEILGVVKERLVERRFNIDEYDRIGGTLSARRNRVDKMVEGLYRKVKIKVAKEKKEREACIYLEWSGAYSASAVTFFEAGLISLAVLRGLGLEGIHGILISVLVGAMGSLLNMIAFNILRVRLTRTLRQDIRDLEEEGAERKKDSK